MTPFALPGNRIRPYPFKLLSSERIRSVLILDAYLEKSLKGEGHVCQQWMGEWIENDSKSEKDLREWMKERFSAEREKIGMKGEANHAIHSGRFDEACKKADQGCDEEIWVGTWESNPPTSDLCTPCPQVLFGKGRPPDAFPSWTAVFNSRKSKGVSPHESWLAFLRFSLPRLCSAGSGLASSRGTLTYDLVTAYAHKSASPLLAVLPFPLEETRGSKPDLSPFSFSPTFFHSMVTCQTRAVRCPKAVRMVCRDRLLAFFSDFHLILEIRPKGNLQKILQKQQTVEPRRQWVLIPSKRTPRNAGNFQLMETFPEWAEPIEEQALDDFTPHKALPVRMPVKILRPEEVSWNDYLYHYTRSCPGPWPGQSCEDYLLSLLQGDPLCGHTASDTLIRILREERIRAGPKLIRGKHAVISWTSRPPAELDRIRRWNPALIRWTFEPYGIAIKREVLKRQGCKPVIYASGETYARLRASDRFRFQRHEPPRCRWKQEREWRLPRDFDLREMAPEDSFLFVGDEADAERLAHSSLRVVVTTMPVNEEGACL